MATPHEVVQRIAQFRLANTRSILQGPRDIHRSSQVYSLQFMKHGGILKVVVRRDETRAEGAKLRGRRAPLEDAPIHLSIDYQDPDAPKAPKEVKKGLLGKGDGSEERGSGLINSLRASISGLFMQERV